MVQILLFLRLFDLLLLYIFLKVFTGCLVERCQTFGNTRFNFKPVRLVFPEISRCFDSKLSLIILELFPFCSMGLLASFLGSIHLPDYASMTIGRREVCWAEIRTLSDLFVSEETSLASIVPFTAPRITISVLQYHNKIKIAKYCEYFARKTDEGKDKKYRLVITTKFIHKYLILISL